MAKWRIATRIRQRRTRSRFHDEIETLKTTYFHLAYLQQTLGILQRNAVLLQQVEQQAEAHYSPAKEISRMS